ncbi:hypothetical protein Ddc_17046 [Ditylenchus destructor]|nr:hypothetical protein Ddc_17046 [Ditylenchus destructor]
MDTQNKFHWKLEHFFRLLTDPFVYIRRMELPSQNDALNLLAGGINPDYGHLQCHRRDVDLKDNTQNLMSWIKGHVRCYNIYIMNWQLLSFTYSGLNDDDEFIDFFMTGGNCTSEIAVNFYDPCKAIGNLVQKFMDLKGCDGNKIVGFIECHPDRKVNIDALKRDYADFVVEGNINDTSPLSNLVFDFVNNDIGKKLQLSIRIDFGYGLSEFTLKVANL